jgi:hypothetical protein
MQTNLRPLALGEILDRTAQLYRERFWLFAGIFSVYAGVALALNLLLLGLQTSLKAPRMAASAIWIAMAAGAVEVLILLLLYGAAVAAISRAVAWVHLGKPATIRSAYASILPRLGRYLWLMTIVALIVLTPVAALYGGYFGIMAYYVKGFATDPAAQQAALSNPRTMAIFGVASLIFVLLMIPAGVYTILMGLRYALAMPAAVVEDLKARPALRRGIELSKGARGRIFLLALLIVAIRTGLVMISQAFVFVAAFKHPGQPLGPGITALSQIVAFFTNTFLGPILATGLTLLYYDQRVRKEGYDIEWMMQAAGLTPPALQSLSETAEPAADDAAGKPA